MTVNVDDVVGALEQRIIERRRLGQYPIGLEAELEFEFDTILAAMRRRELSTAVLAGRVEALRGSVQGVIGTAAADSRVPGGTVIHRVAGRVVGRHTNQLADHVRRIGQESVGVLTEVVRLFEAQRGADERQLNEVIAAVFDRLVVVDEMVTSIGEIERRLVALESVASAAF